MRFGDVKFMPRHTFLHGNVTDEYINGVDRQRLDLIRL